MNQREKLVENTILALQGKLIESNNWSYKPTKNSDYARSIAKRAKFNSEEYVDRLYKDNPYYDIYEKALKDLNNQIKASNMFIDDVQIMTSYSGLLGLVAVCKNEVTKDFEYNSSFESGIFVHVDENTKEVSYRFAVKDPEEINVISYNTPSKELISSVRRYLFLSEVETTSDFIFKKVKQVIPNITMGSKYTTYKPVFSVQSSIYQYRAFPDKGDNGYVANISVTPDFKNYTCIITFKDKKYTNIDDVVKAIEEDYNEYINNTKEEK